MFSAVARFLVVGCVFFLASRLQAADSAGVESAKPALSSATNLLTGNFKVNTNTLWEGLENVEPPQVNIRAKFLEMEGGGKGDPLFSFLSSLSPQPAIWISSSARSNSVRPLGPNNPTFTAILTPAQLRVAFRALELRQTPSF
jgi:hypothetical protein